MAKAPVREDAAATPSRDLQDVALEASSLASLLRWVSDAQMTMSQLRDVIDGDPILQQRLSAWHLGYNSPEIYCKDVDMGLYFVHSRQLELIDQLGGGAA